MKNALTFVLVLGPLGWHGALAQRPEPAASNTLSRALSTFGAADADKNGKVSLAEVTANKLPIQKVDFDAMDVDKDGSWARDEFLVFYRRLLINSGQRAAADLESEVTRIQALRRARAGEKDKARPVEPPRIDAPLAPTIEERLTIAIADLEKKAAARQATRQDFQRVRDAMMDRARIALAQDPAGAADLEAKFEAALAGIETKARAGGYTREEFDALRGLLVTRAREAVKNAAQAKTDAEAKAAEAKAAAQAQAAANEAREKDRVAIETRFAAAIDDLAKKAEARQATREDFNRVRELYAARARAAAGSGPEVELVGEEQLSGPASRFGRAIDALEQAARDGKYTREEYDALRDSYVTRARAAAGSKAAVDGVKGESVPVTTPPSGAPVVNATTIEQRFDEAVDVLEQRALARGATREDFERVHGLLAARARAAFTAQNGGVPIAEDDPRLVDLTTKVRAALDRLERAAAEGAVKREDFAAVRQMLLRRAREAVGGPPTPGSAPAPNAGTNPAPGVAPAPGRAPTDPNAAPTPGSTPGRPSGPAEGRGAKPVDAKPAEGTPVPPKPTPADATRTGSTDAKTGDPVPAPEVKPTPPSGETRERPQPAPTPAPERPKPEPKVR